MQRAGGHARKNSGSNGAGRSIGGFIGTIEGKSLLFGDVLAGLRIQDYLATRELYQKR